MEYKTRIDWLSMTGKVKYAEGDQRPNLLHEVAELGRRILHDLGRGEPPIRTVPAARYYSVSIEDAQTGIRINFGEDLSRQGWQVVISGSACKHFDNYQVLRNFADVWKARITRCDVAIDLIYSGVSVSETADTYRERTEGKGKAWSLIRGRTGDTWYLGSRTSERFVRVYDKGGEQGLDIDWKRCELEAKGGEAQHLFETYTSDWLAAVGEIRDFINCPAGNPVWGILNKITMGEVAHRVMTPRTVSDREKWLRGQVLAAFENMALEDEAAAERVFADWHETYIALRFWRAVAKKA